MLTPGKRKLGPTAEITPERPTTDAPRQSATPKLPTRSGFSQKHGLSKKDPKQKDDVPYPSGYRVKEEFTETAQHIFRRHGDIVANSLFKGTLRMDMLHSTYDIYEKLKRSKFSFLALEELKSMCKDVEDLGKTQLKVSWLAERLDEIYEAKMCVERSPSIKEELEKNKRCIETLEKELSLRHQDILAIRTKLKLEKAKTATILRTFLEAKETSPRFSWKSSENGSLNIPASACCKVNKEFESAAQVILSNQGDIVANCLFEGSLRCRLLESACAIYKKMEKMSLKDITLAELEDIQKDVLDLETAQVDVSWVSKGLDDMYETKKSLESPLFKEKLLEENSRNIKMMEKDKGLQEDNVREISEKLDAEKARTATLEQNLFNAREKVSRFFRKSLVDGI